MTRKLIGENSVVVGVDGLDQRYGAVRYAAREAWRLGVPLDVVHVVPGYVPAGSMMMMTLPDEAFQAYGAEILERAAAAAHESEAEAQVATHLLVGGRLQQLLTTAERARLIVLGRRDPRGRDRMWTGGTVTGIASQATCPVTVVPHAGEEGFQHRRIVAGYKSSAHTAELLRTAFVLADETGAELVVLHAWRLQGVYDDILADRAEEERWQQEEQEQIETELVDYRAAFPDVPVRVFVRHEDAVRALVRASSGADRLLIERPAHGSLVHHLGRTARAVIREAHCPVAVLAPGHRGEASDARSSAERSGELVP